MDSRDIAHTLRWWVYTDGKIAHMVAYGEEDEDGMPIYYPVPIEMIVCPTCRGRGTYVNPSIDSHGLSREDFDGDSDFHESYMNREYDIRCEHCLGTNVIPWPTTLKHRKRVKSFLAARYYDQTVSEAERRMGA